MAALPTCTDSLDTGDMPYLTLNTGARMPAVGLGCWMGADGTPSEAGEMCRNALKCGYRHIDTAAGYDNEAVVGKAIRESGIPRSEIFVTTKLWSTAHHTVREAFEASLAALDIEYIDLYLMHWPQAIIDGRTLKATESPTYHDTWRAMEALLATNKVKAIGVSNFATPHLSSLLATCNIVPAVNQIQVHPSLPNVALQRFCESRGVKVVAYSPFGMGNKFFFEDGDLVRVAGAHGADVGQVVVSWCVQRGLAVLPKSANPRRMVQNKTLVSLSQEEMDAISAIHTKPGMHRSLIAYPGGPGGAFGWTFAELGWPFAEDGQMLPGTEA